MCAGCVPGALALVAIPHQPWPSRYLQAQWLAKSLAGRGGALRVPGVRQTRVCSGAETGRRPGEVGSESCLLALDPEFNLHLPEALDP